MAGIADYSGCKKCGPLPLGIQAADVAGGSLHTVIGILSAVVYRERTGLGQAIDISITDASFALNGLAGSGYLAGGEEPEQGKMLLNGGTFYDYYATKDGRFVSVMYLKMLCAERLLAKPVNVTRLGDTISVVGKIVEIREEGHEVIVTSEVKAVDQNGEEKITGFFEAVLSK